MAAADSAVLAGGDVAGADPEQPTAARAATTIEHTIAARGLGGGGEDIVAKIIADETASR